MTPEKLDHLVKESYPFPIAFAYKKTLGQYENNDRKLKLICDTAEVVIQFLALAALAQVRLDLGKNQAPVPADFDAYIKGLLRNPSFGKWHGLLRDTLKCYRDHRHLLIIPELYDLYFQPGGSRRVRQQPLIHQVIEPLMKLRNKKFSHEMLITSDREIADRVSQGMGWLHQLLEALSFLSRYHLSYVQKISVDRGKDDEACYTHELLDMQGCNSAFDQSRWESAIFLREEVIVLLQDQEGRHLILNPFLVMAYQAPVPGVQDIFLLKNLEKGLAEYTSLQFGQTLATINPAWSAGRDEQKALTNFFGDLRQAGPEPEVELELEAGSEVEEEASPSTTAEIFQNLYAPKTEALPEGNPYKFLDYYNPEDRRLFFGRERETQLLWQKFLTSRLLVLHGKSGVGKTSLIRAGLIPRLPPEQYVPIYVRVLKEPNQAIKLELIYQLGRDDRNLELSLPEFLRKETELVSRTVIIVLDQFEEFFLRFEEPVRQAFIRDLAACLENRRLDVRFLISLRDDYFSRLSEFEAEVPAIFTHHLQLAPLTFDQALEAAVKPAEELGFTVDRDMMAEDILPELTTAGEIEAPLLQIICDRLYQEALKTGSRTLGRAEYRALGDVKGALGRYLDETLDRFGKDQVTAKKVLKSLITSEGTKRASLQEDLPALQGSDKTRLTPEALRRDYLDKFIRYRLVRVEEVAGQTRFELAHDYLVKHIQAWMEERDWELRKAQELFDRAYETHQATHLLLDKNALKLIRPWEKQLVFGEDDEAAKKKKFLKKSTSKRRQWRLLAGAALGIFVLVVTALGIYWDSERRVTKARNLALWVLNKVIVDVYSSLEYVPGTLGLQREIIEVAADNLRQLSEDGGLASAEGDFSLSMAYNHLGCILRRLGLNADAKKYSEKALPLAERLAQHDPDNLLAEINLIKAYGGLMLLESDEGHMAAVRQHSEKLVQLVERLAQRYPDNFRALFDLSLSNFLLGNVALQEGLLAAARQYSEKALQLTEPLAQSEPDNVEAQLRRANSYRFLGGVAAMEGQLAVARQYSGKALQLNESLYQDHAWNPQAALESQLAAAVRELEKALQRTDSPYRIKFDLADSYDAVGLVILAEGQPTAAREYFEKALELRGDNSEFENQLKMADSYIYLGIVAQQTGQLELARAYFADAMIRMRNQADSLPDNVQAQLKLADSYSNWGAASQNTGYLAEAKSCLEKALELREPLAKKNQDNPQAQSVLAISYDELGEINLKENNFREARVFFGKGLKLREPLAQKNPDNPQNQHALAISYSNLGEVSLKEYDELIEVKLKENKLKEARVFFGKGSKLRQPLAEKNPDNVEFQRSLVISYDKLGEVSLKEGKLKEARTYWKTVLPRLEALIRTAPDYVQLRIDQVENYLKLGLVSQKAGQAGEAASWRRKALEKMRQLDDQGRLTPQDKSMLEKLVKEMKELKRKNN